MERETLSIEDNLPHIKISLCTHISNYLWTTPSGSPQQLKLDKLTMESAS